MESYTAVIKSFSKETNFAKYSKRAYDEFVLPSIKEYGTLNNWEKMREMLVYELKNCNEKTNLAFLRRVEAVVDKVSVMQSPIFNNRNWNQYISNKIHVTQIISAYNNINAELAYRDKNKMDELEFNNIKNKIYDDFDSRTEPFIRSEIIKSISSAFQDKKIGKYQKHQLKNMVDIFVERQACKVKIDKQLKLQKGINCHDIQLFIISNKKYSCVADLFETLGQLIMKYHSIPLLENMFITIRDELLGNRLSNYWFNEMGFMLCDNKLVEQFFNTIIDKKNILNNLKLIKKHMENVKFKPIENLKNINGKKLNEADADMIRITMLAKAIGLVDNESAEMFIKKMSEKE